MPICWRKHCLVGGFKHFLFFISYMGCHPSHWRTHIFQDGYSTTNQLWTHSLWFSSGWWFGTMEFYDFPFSWECHHPNWRTPSFFRWVGITTNQWSIEFLWINIDLPGFTHIKTRVFQYPVEICVEKSCQDALHQQQRASPGVVNSCPGVLLGFHSAIRMVTFWGWYGMALMVGLFTTWKTIGKWWFNGD